MLWGGAQDEPGGGQTGVRFFNPRMAAPRAGPHRGQVSKEGPRGASRGRVDQGGGHGDSLVVDLGLLRR